MKHGRFLNNMPDPRKPDAKQEFLSKGWHEYQWDKQVARVAANVIDRPQATQYETQETLEASGLVGLYAPAEGAPE